MIICKLHFLVSVNISVFCHQNFGQLGLNLKLYAAFYLKRIFLFHLYTKIKCQIY